MSLKSVWMPCKMFSMFAVFSLLFRLARTAQMASDKEGEGPWGGKTYRGGTGGGSIEREVGGAVASIVSKVGLV